VALGSMRPFLLAVHVVLGSMFAAALGAHDDSEFADLESRLTGLLSSPPLSFCVHTAHSKGPGILFPNTARLGDEQLPFCQVFYDPQCIQAMH